MSTMMLSVKLFETIAYNAKFFQYNKEVNESYCSTLSMDDDSIEKWVLDLCKLNERSYCKRYKEKEEKLYKFLDFKKPQKRTDIYQFLKYLHCLSYNIDGFKKTKSVLILRRAIEEIKYNIINEIESYKIAEWCS